MHTRQQSQHRTDLAAAGGCTVQAINWLGHTNTQACLNPGQQYHILSHLYIPASWSGTCKTNIQVCHSTLSTLLLKVLCVNHVGLELVRKAEGGGETP